MSVVFDIETLALPEPTLRQMFKSGLGEPPEPFDFDESTVKYGRLKDPEKRAAKLADAKEKHVKQQKDAITDYLDKAQKEFDKFLADAALSPVTSQVAIIAYHGLNTGKTAVIQLSGEMDNEKDMLETFWNQCEVRRKNSESMVGVNIHDFDLPYLRQRSWILGVEVPEWVIVNNRYWDRTFVDIRKVWMCGKYAGSGVAFKSSFDWLAMAFGTQGKPDGVDGSDFGRLWEEDRKAAVDYAVQDVEQPAIWCERMGIL